MFTLKKLLAPLAACLCLLSGTTHAANFPDRPVRIILPFPPGTAPDTVIRQVGEKLAEDWKTPVIVDNRPGANGWIAMDAAKRATPDGYTLVLVDTPLMALQPHLYKKLKFDPTTDFVPVAGLYRTAFLVTVSADAPFKTVADLIAAAKAQPGALTFGSSGYGGNLHLGGATLQDAAGIQLNHVPYKETAQIYMDISRGDITWAFGSAATTAPLYTAKKLKYLAIAAPKRSESLPDVPTLHESLGAKGFDLQTWIALFAPRDTPRDIVDKVNADIKKVLERPDIRKSLLSVGLEPFPQTPDQLETAMQQDSKQYADIVSRMKISLD